MSAGSLEQLRGSVPATPGTGRTSLWVDSTSGALHKINDSAVQSSLEDYKGADIADGATLTIPTTGNYFSCPTGTTTVTAIAYAGAVHFLGRKITIVFGSARSITHNATSLILPNGQNIVTSVGIVMTFVEESSGNWRCINRQDSLWPVMHTTKSGGSQTPSGGGVFDLLTWDAPTLDTNGMFSANTATIPTGADGDYLISAMYLASGVVAGDQWSIAVYKNGVSVLESYETVSTANGNTVQIGTTLRLVGADTIKIYGMLATARTTQVYYGATAKYAQFKIARIN